MPHLPPSPSSRRVTRRGFLAVSAIAVPAAWAAGTSGVASAAPARRAEAASSAVALAWHDITKQAVGAANFAEPVTQSRTWAVSWLAAARALRGHNHGDYAVAAFAQALHDTLAAQVPSQQEVTVLFDEDGYREMFVPLVLERGLLRACLELDTRHMPTGTHAHDAGAAEAGMSSPGSRHR